MLYDEQAELERAYAAWLEAGDASDFQTWGLSQRIVPTALSEGVAYFLTTVERPVGNFIMEQQRIGSAFDRETGEYIEAWELFTCPPDEAVRRILDLSELTEPEQRAEMEAAFEPECLTFFEDRLEVSFDRGVLPSCETGFTLVLDLDEDRPAPHTALGRASKRLGNLRKPPDAARSGRVRGLLLWQNTGILAL